jgi:quercetin dioxygenase-like cupin family protein
VRTTHHLPDHVARVPPDFAAESGGFQKVSHFGFEDGAVHTDIGTCGLEPRGRLGTHLHAFEEIVFVLEGRPQLTLSGRQVEMSMGDGALIDVAAPHSWQNPYQESARWIEVQAPPRRPSDRIPDTIFVDPPGGEEPVTFDPADPALGRFTRLWPPSTDEWPEGEPRAAGMAAPMMSLPGIIGRPFIDERHGAALLKSFVVEFAPDSTLGIHDHPFEESFYVLDGRVAFIADGVEHVLAAGEVGFAPVGCRHGFENRGTEPCRWLETQSPLPPSRHDIRGAAVWSSLARRHRRR